MLETDSLRTQMRFLPVPLALTATLFASPVTVVAQRTPIDTVKVSEVTILGIEQHNELFANIPGSVSKVSAKEIRLLMPVNGNEVFRRVPGLNVVDEEGVGLSGFVQNKFQLTDNRYVASRRPEDIRVGTPRLLAAGIDVTF